MSYTDDAMRAKLSSLNEAQDTIVTVAQWIIFHKRMALRTAEIWLAKLNETSPSKRLSLIYLANEVVQQSKARKKEDFVNAFTPLIAEGTAVAYKGASLDLQQKIRRVIEVWRQRSIFNEKTQADVEAKLDQIDRQRASRGGLGGSLFAGAATSVPSQLQPVAGLCTTLTKAESTSTTSQATFKSNEDSTRNHQTSLPIKAAQLGALLASLTEVETAVSGSIQARQNLVAGLEKLIADNKLALARDEEAAASLKSKRTALSSEKENIERMILRGSEPEPEPDRPEAEALTPPPVENITPVGSPKAEEIAVSANQAEEEYLPPVVADTIPVHHDDRMNDASIEQQQPSAKKRKLNQVEEQPSGMDFGAIDPEVAALLGEN